MEAALPPERSLIIGVDEHTAVLFDLDARTASVVGNGCLTLRRAGRSTAFPSGARLTFDEIAAGPSGDCRPAAAAVPVEPDAAAPAASAQPSLRADADALDARFAAALAARDVDGCVAAVLDLEQVIVDWSTDTLTSDEGDHARAVFRGMVVRLGELARVGARDPRAAVAPLVEALLTVRADARAAKDFAASDAVRDRLSAAGIEVRDTPDGATWELA